MTRRAALRTTIVVSASRLRQQGKSETGLLERCPFPIGITDSVAQLSSSLILDGGGKPIEFAQVQCALQ